MIRCFIAIILLFPLFAKTQVDPQKLDSLVKAIDSSGKVVQRSQDRFIKNVDSVYHSAQLQSHQKNIERDLQLKRKEEKRQENRVCIIAGVLLLILLIVLLKSGKPKT